jgi:hypothetical protein
MAFLHSTFFFSTQILFDRKPSQWWLARVLFFFFLKKRSQTQAQRRGADEYCCPAPCFLRKYIQFWSRRARERFKHVLRVVSGKKYWWMVLRVFHRKKFSSWVSTFTWNKISACSLMRINKKIVHPTLHTYLYISIILFLYLLNFTFVLEKKFLS